MNFIISYIVWPVSLSYLIAGADGDVGPQGARGEVGFQGNKGRSL